MTRNSKHRKQKRKDREEVLYKKVVLFAKNMINADVSRQNIVITLMRQHKITKGVAKQVFATAAYACALEAEVEAIDAQKALEAEALSHMITETKEKE